MGGKIQTLCDEPGRNELVIPPFEVAVIKTYETLNMPKFLIARWNIQVKRAYDGLLWVGGPQVDAGYVGHLFCPIYNLSNKDVVLKFAEPFAVIDFIKTTDFHSGQSVDYSPIPPERLLIEDYNLRQLQSALATIVSGRLEQVERQVSNFERRATWFIGFTLTLIAILFAGMAVFVTSGDPKSIPIISWASIGIAVTAILIALGATDKYF